MEDMDCVDNTIDHLDKHESIIDIETLIWLFEEYEVELYE